MAHRAALIALPWLIVIGIWYAIAYSGLINPSLVPTPHRVAWRFWELLTTARLPLDILMSILAEGHTSRLYRTLVYEKQLARASRAERKAIKKLLKSIGAIPTVQGRGGEEEAPAGDDSKAA